VAQAVRNTASSMGNASAETLFFMP